jgi:outer membrane lipoprotein LolB
VRRALALLALCLSACASVAPPPPQGWSGKLGYRVDATPTQRAQAGSALFELSGTAAAGQLRLTSALGTLLAEAQWSALGVSLKTERGEQAYASLDELGLALGEALQGPALPLAALFDWLQGRPWPQAAHAPAEGGFRQLGWRVEHRPPLLLMAQPGINLRLVLTP